MPDITSTDTHFEVPGFPGKKFEWIPEAKEYPEVKEAILRNIQPDVIEKILIADGRFSDRFIRRYRRNLKAQGWEVANDS